MQHPRYPNDEIVRRGEELYERDIRPKVEPDHHGCFLALDIETGEYEIDSQDILAIQRAKAKRPDAALYIVRVGYRSAYKLGGRFQVSPS